MECVALFTSSLWARLKFRNIEKKSLKAIKR
jgi:hypothetical protein